MCLRLDFHPKQMFVGHQQTAHHAVSHTVFHILFCLLCRHTVVMAMHKLFCGRGEAGQVAALLACVLHSVSARHVSICICVDLVRPSAAVSTSPKPSCRSRSSCSTAACGPLFQAYLSFLIQPRAPHPAAPSHPRF